MPMESFHVPVRDEEQAALVFETLGRYDAFQFKNKIKPDYSNAGGLQVFEDGEWVDWEDPDEGYDFDEWMGINWKNEEDRMIELDEVDEGE